MSAATLVALQQRRQTANCPNLEIQRIQPHEKKLKLKKKLLSSPHNSLNT
jgi:hypothetical protein